MVLGKANRLELMEQGDEAPGAGRGPRDERRARPGEGHWKPPLSPSPASSREVVPEDVAGPLGLLGGRPRLLSLQWFLYVGKSRRLVALSLGEDGEWQAEMGSSPLRPPVRLSRAEPGGDASTTWSGKWKDQ